MSTQALGRARIGPDSFWWVDGETFAFACGGIRLARGCGLLGSILQAPGPYRQSASVLHSSLVVRYSPRLMPVISQETDGCNRIKVGVIPPMTGRAQVGEIVGFVVLGLWSRCTTCKHVLDCRPQTTQHVYGYASSAARCASADFRSLVSARGAAGLLSAEATIRNLLAIPSWTEAAGHSSQPNSVSTYRTTSSPATPGMCRCSGPAGMCSISPGPATTSCPSN